MPRVTRQTNPFSVSAHHRYLHVEREESMAEKGKGKREKGKGKGKGERKNPWTGIGWGAYQYVDPHSSHDEWFLYHQFPRDKPFGDFFLFSCLSFLFFARNRPSHVSPQTQIRLMVNQTLLKSHSIINTK